MRRDALIHLLTEAAEIEHNLLCSYLYAAFSLKRGQADGLTEPEAEAVAGWRKTILGVAIEEMGHLALVNNLLVALGGAPHFDRPNLPVPPGYHPAGFVIRLMPFTKPTLDHFIYLERPAHAAVPEGEGGYRRHVAVERIPTPGDLTPSTPDYETIGEFYAAIRTGLETFAQAQPKSTFLTASASRQLSPETVSLPGLIVIRTLEDALKALDVIIEQGEGSSCEKGDCHFTRFQEMRSQWAALERDNPAFVPYHEAAHDPVMRKPAEGLKRVWVTEPRAAMLLDLGNALYALALTLLHHAYAPLPGSQASLVGASIELMHALGAIGTRLATLPAQPSGRITAGLTFAVPRNLHDMQQQDLSRLLRERVSTLCGGAQALGLNDVSTILEKVEATLTPRARASVQSQRRSLSN